MVLVVTNPGAPQPDAGPMQGQPDRFRRLEVGKVAQELAKL